MFGSLSSIWGGLIDTQELSRDQIRSFQELGINLLNYAAQRHEIASSLRINPKYSSDPTVTSDQRRITNMTAS